MNISYEYLPIETVKRIKQLAKAKGVKMQDLADSTGLSTNTIAKSAKGTEGMKAKNLFLIAEMLECSVDYLLGRTDDPTVHADHSVKIVNSSNGDNSPFAINTGENSGHDDSDLSRIFNELSPEDKIKVLYEALQLKNKNNED